MEFQLKTTQITPLLSIIFLVFMTACDGSQGPNDFSDLTGRLSLSERSGQQSAKDIPTKTPYPTIPAPTPIVTPLSTIYIEATPVPQLPKLNDDGTVMLNMKLSIKKGDRHHYQEFPNGCRIREWSVEWGVNEAQAEWGSNAIMYPVAGSGNGSYENPVTRAFITNCRELYDIGLIEWKNSVGIPLETER